MKLLPWFVDFLFVLGTIHFFRTDGMWTQWSVDYGVKPDAWHNWGYLALGVLCFVAARLTFKWGTK